MSLVEHPCAEEGCERPATVGVVTLNNVTRWLCPEDFDASLKATRDMIDSVWEASKAARRPAPPAPPVEAEPLPFELFRARYPTMRGSVPRYPTRNPRVWE